MRSLDPSELRGRITAVPVVNMPSFRERTAFVSHQDGKNLNRCFPGDPDGTFSDVLAHAVFERLIAPADVLLDLHGGDMVEALEPFTLYDESAVEDRARELAIAFGLLYVLGEQLGGCDGPAAGQFEQCRRCLSGPFSELAVKREDRAGERSAAHDELARDRTCTSGLRCASHRPTRSSQTIRSSAPAGTANAGSS